MLRSNLQLGENFIPSGRGGSRRIGFGGYDALAESNAAGNITDEYIFFGGKRIARRDAAGNVYYLLADHLGTARVVTNATGVVVQESDYYPFGGERVVVNTVDNRYKFTGKERDAESGNDYFGARYYASRLGRWLSPDWSAAPVAVPYADLANPQTLNLYAYVENNPLTGMDPDGHFRQAVAEDTGNQYQDPDLQPEQQQKPQPPNQPPQSAQQAEAQQHNAQNNSQARTVAMGAAAGAVVGAIVGGVAGAAAGAGAGTAVAPGVGTIIVGLAEAAAGAQSGAEMGAAVGAAAGALAPVVYSKTRDAAKKVPQQIERALEHLKKLGGPDHNPDPRRGWRQSVRDAANQLDKQANRIANKKVANSLRLLADFLRGAVTAE